MNRDGARPQRQHPRADHGGCSGHGMPSRRRGQRRFAASDGPCARSRDSGLPAARCRGPAGRRCAAAPGQGPLPRAQPGPCSAGKPDPWADRLSQTAARRSSPNPFPWLRANAATWYQPRSPAWPPASWRRPPGRTAASCGLAADQGKTRRARDPRPGTRVRGQQPPGGADHPPIRRRPPDLTGHRRRRQRRQGGHQQQTDRLQGPQPPPPPHRHLVRLHRHLLRPPGSRSTAPPRSSPYPKPWTG